MIRALLIAAAGGYAAYRYLSRSRPERLQREAGDYDDVLAQRVRERLAGFGEIQVSAHQGTVTLRGSVPPTRATGR